MAECESGVEIGYLERTEAFKLESRFFPSKVGGKPAWLDLKNISVDTSCGVCGKPCVFLCQLYAPIDGQSNAYHRTIYVFVCTRPDCCDVNRNDNFVVYRCQLTKENGFYPAEEPVDVPDWHPGSRVENFSPTCVVCGCFGPFRCGKCKTVRYCSKEHQTLDWKSGHSAACGSDGARPASVLFPEYELVTEAEELEEESTAKQEKSDEEKLREYEELVSQGKAGTLDNVPSSVLEQFAEGKEDKFFKKFKCRLRLAPDQVVRYARGGTPLWIATPNLSEESIPQCQVCQSPRQFEFQILSTMLAHLNVDSLDKSVDWGTLLVYTCKNNCSEGPAYKREFLWKQDIL